VPSGDASVQAQIIELSNQLDQLLDTEARDDEAIADIYLKIFELAPHERIGKLAALNAYAYLSALSRSQAALGLLEEVYSVYLPDEECPNPLDIRYPIRLAATAKVEKARVLARRGLYQAALEELLLVRRGRKAGTEGFSGMPVGRFRYFGPTEVLVDLFTVDFISKLDAAAGLVRYRSLMKDYKGSPSAWLNVQGVRYSLDRAVAEKVFRLVSDELFLFARADQELKAAFSGCWTDECRAETLLLRARLRNLRPEGKTQAKASEQETFLAELIAEFEGVLIRRLESDKVLVEKPSCVAAMELSRLYRRTNQHVRGLNKLKELLDGAKDREVRGHLTLAIAELSLDSEGPTSHATLDFYKKCLTEYAFEPYYPYSERKPRFLVDAVPASIRKEVVGEPRR